MVDSPIASKQVFPDCEDVEKDGSRLSVKTPRAVATSPGTTATPLSIWQQLSAAGVEHRGSKPVPVEQRTDTKYFNIFTTMCTPMLSILPIGTGIVPTYFYGLSLRDAFLLVWFFSFIFTAPAAYLITIAPQTGMRQMLQSRFSFGYWPNAVATLLTMLTVGGFSVIATSIGSQCLLSVSNGAVPQEAGIVLIAVPAMIIAFFGFSVISRYLRWGWVPTLFAVFCIIGYGAPEFRAQAVPAHAPTVFQVFQMISLMAGYMITWGNVVGDYAIYMPPNAPKLRLFCYCLFGLCLPIALMLTLGAAIGGAIAANPSWGAAYETYSIGGVLGAILDKGGNFGKFVLVLLTFSVIATTSRDMYSISVDFHVLMPGARHVPRAVWVLVAGCSIIGVAIGAIHAFYEAMTNFIYIIGYWAGSYTSVVVLEWVVFRHRRGDSYAHAIWDDRSKLTPGWAASLSSLLPWGLIVPCMDQSWYTGPIAKVTGDLGFEVAIVGTALLYVPLRKLEIKWRGGKL